MVQIFHRKVQLLVILTCRVSWEDRLNFQIPTKLQEEKRTAINITNLGKFQRRVVTILQNTINQHSLNMPSIIVVTSERRDRAPVTFKLNNYLQLHRLSQPLEDLISLLNTRSKLLMLTKIQTQELEWINLKRIRKNQGPDSQGNRDSQLHRKKSKI